ncbi:MAG TPA: bifunctional pyr operon transcriptional regulator/uracil phosphoribosyltransferase PyrR [Syntrophorhabdales bacterium]|nr:bifunctional pyr operon transcriptional regulator/uracil phosphoribosyltransferase PyrR [Syntrophorhabdales bacterium]
MEPKALLDEKAIERSILRITHQILEKNSGSGNLSLVGIRTRGIFLAKRIQEQIRAIENKEVPVGVLDITMYRDDVFKLKTPEVKKTEIPFDVNNITLVLVDDVMHTGRTTRAAIDAIMDLGRPKRIQLAVLVDRGSREMPIHPDYRGIFYPATPDQEIFVKLHEIDGVDEVILTQAA